MFITMNHGQTNQQVWNIKRVTMMKTDCWYTETSDGNWDKLDDSTYEEFQDRLWHIEYEF